MTGPMSANVSVGETSVENFEDYLYVKGIDEADLSKSQRAKLYQKYLQEKNMMDSPNEAVGKLTAEIDKKEKANQNLLDFVKTLGGEPTQEQKIEADQANSRILQKTAAKNRKKEM